ncbi:perlucin-like protein [Mytilus edulis]|uniref:perlucin-like protein n=1 Tax=Mytilus edulis TaxID=6550 RepID=UPI0039EF21BC
MKDKMKTELLFFNFLVLSNFILVCTTNTGDIIIERNSVIPGKGVSTIVRSELACTFLCLKDKDCCFANYRDSTKECMVGMSMCHAETISENGWTFLRRGSAYKNKVFFYFGNAVPWNDAQGYCGSFGMRLASVSNSDENKFLKSLTTQSSGVWLGGSDLLQEDKWKWDKPTRSITYYDWGYYNGIPQPNDLFNQDCLTYGLSDPFETQYTWDDQTCSNDYPFLCERIVRVDSENWPIE